MPRSTFFENASNAAFRDTTISNVHRDIVNNHNPANQYTIHSLNYTTNNYITNHTTNNNHYYGGVEARGDREVHGGGDAKAAHSKRPKASLEHSPIRPPESGMYLNISTWRCLPIDDSSQNFCSQDAIDRNGHDVLREDDKSPRFPGSRDPPNVLESFGHCEWDASA
ncbi:hypothetical protein L218DRAFT_950388 [Marasmius fiardii PR-910]|nr:hypothetical protein L218DRAFT_950388 [Marasmius fiardii PR-910]